MLIKAVKANIVKVANVEAIVNAASPLQKGTSGVNGTIHKAAGPELFEEYKSLGGCGVGEAKITKAYNLPYKAVIHTVGPTWKGGKAGEEILLKNCYYSVLKLAEEQGIRSIAFPSISTGTYKFPLQKAAKIAVETVFAYCEEHPNAFDYICWALLVESTRIAYDEEILKHTGVEQEWLIVGPEDLLRLRYSLSVSDIKMLPNGMRAIPLEGSLPEEEFDNIIKTDFSSRVPKTDQWEYTFAVASGMLSGVLSVFWGRELNLEDAHNWGSEKINKFVIGIATAQGFTAKTEDSTEEILRKAITFLENKFPMAGDSVMNEMGGTLQHHLRDFTHHPTVIGLIFSILSQFTEKGFGTDTSGLFMIVDLPEKAVIGKNFEEKILLGLVYWAFHLVSDMAGSSNSPGKGTGIPGPILSFLKEVSSFPVFQNAKIKYKEAEITFSQWLSKVFNGTFFRNEMGETIRFDLRTEIGLGDIFLRQVIPVAINECLVRGMYFFRHLYLEFKNKKIESFDELEKLDPQNFLPFNNRVIRRMLSVSTGAFVLINTFGTAIKVAATNAGNPVSTSTTFLLNLNYVGIVRFGIACVADAKYIAEDVREAYENYKKIQDEKKEKTSKQAFNDYSFLTLDEDKLSLLYSLEHYLVQYDIKNTKSEASAGKKKAWLENWEQNICASLEMKKEEVYIATEDEVFSRFCQEWEENKDRSWIPLLALELSLFQAYYPLNDDKAYKGLKATSDYISDIFCFRQSFISSEQIKNLKKSVIRNEAILSGKTQKAIMSAAGVAVVVAVSGGVALAYAPHIAIALAGKAVAGLYGAALTKASLALIGGGALATGGLGVAGGTAILTGGGALLGLTTSGSASLMYVFANTPESYILRECAKLITMSKTVLEDVYGRQIDNVKKVKNQLDYSAESIKDDIKLAEMQTADKDRAEIRKMKAGYNYMVKCSKEIGKLLDKVLGQ